MNLNDEQKEKLKCKIEGGERNLRREHVIKAAHPEHFSFGGLAGSILLFLFNLFGQWVFHQEAPQ